MFILLFGVVLFALQFLFPATYNVQEFAERKGTQYWQIKEGEKIGYIKLTGNKSDNRIPIIYLHGGPGGQVADEVIEALRPLNYDGHDVYLYDQIGSGHSTRLHDIVAYSVERHKEDLLEIINRIGADKVILIGHSWGACLAINYLQEFPESVAKIILAGPGPILPIKRNLANISPPDSLHLIEPEYSNKEANEKVYNWRNKTILKWAQLFNAKLVSDKEADSFFTYLNENLSKSTNCTLEEQKVIKGGDGYYSHIMTLKSIHNIENKRHKLRELSTPMLILRGQCDNQKWGYTNEYIDIFKNAKLKIIEGVGHDIVSKQKEEYYQLISDFLVDY